MTLQELRQKNAGLCDQQQAIVDKAVSEGRAMTQEEKTQFDNLQNQIDGLAETIKTAEAIEVRNKALDTPADEKRRPSFIPGEPSQNNSKLDDAGFRNLGEFLHAVRFGDSKGRLSNLRQGQGQGGGLEVPDAFKSSFMPRFRNEWSMGVGAGGGFAVPTQFRPDMLMLQPEASVVRQRATVIPAGDPPDGRITMPAFSQGANGAFGGVTVQWIAEGAIKPETDGELQEVSLTPHEVAAHTVVTDKLLRNWEAADAFISTLLQGAIANTEDFAFLRGDGVGKPLGVLNAPGAINVVRAGAGAIGYVDVVNMLASLLTESAGRAVWVASQSILPALATMQDPAGRYIFNQGDASRSIPATLAGIPIVYTGKTPTLGNRGDLMLVDFSHYLIKDGSGPFIAASEHVLFRQNKTVIKVFWNTDGQGWATAPLTLEDGVTQVSPYVVLV